MGTEVQNLIKEASGCHEGGLKSHLRGTLACSTVQGFRVKVQYTLWPYSSFVEVRGSQGATQAGTGTDSSLGMK